MAELQLDCYPLIRSCVNCAAGELVTAGEEVYIYTHPGQYTDPAFPGWVRATVLLAYKDGNAYNYLLDLNDGDLPANIANLCRDDIASIGCAPCDGLELTVTGGEEETVATSGPSTVTGNIHVWSSSLVVTVTDPGRINIELPYALN